MKNLSTAEVRIRLEAWAGDTMLCLELKRSAVSEGEPL